VFQERARTLESAFLLLDVLCIALSFGIAMVLRWFHPSLPLLGGIPSLPWAAEGAARSDYALLFLTTLLAWVVYLRRSGIYRSWEGSRLDRVLLVYAKAVTLTILSVGAVVFVLKILVSRLFFAYFFATAAALLLAKQGFVTFLLHRVRSSEFHRRHALVIGAERAAVWFAEVIRSARNTGYTLEGVLLTGDRAARSDPAVPILGSIADLDRVLTARPVEEVFIVGSAKERAELAWVAQTLIERGRVVSLVATVSTGSDGVRGRVTDFSGVPMISYGPMPRDGVTNGAKRVMDLVVSAVALALLAPLMLLVALLIKLFDAGPVFFRQQRLGLNGEPFTLLKFRSMRVDAEKVLQSDAALYRRYVANDYKLPEAEDPRISRIGRFLRRSSLDELPQLWNVLRGDMTLVGPRPIVPAEIEKYRPFEDFFLSVRPGVTGHWQVEGRSDVQYPDRAYLDLDYVGSYSVLGDLAIILRTVPAVVRRRGAF